MVIERRVKFPSRIPGLAVGEGVETQDGPKKKVCFHIGGRWIFRMVDTDWVAPGRPHGRSKRKAELKSHKALRNLHGN